MDSQNGQQEWAVLEQRLGHVFAAPERLAAALTHRSYSAEAGRPDEAENQRLEFLGDAVLGAVAAEWLLGHCPGWPEGPLTKVRSRLTNAAALARVARRLELGGFLRLGKGEELSGGRERSAVLADALEALLGALWLDGGVAAVLPVFEKWFAEELTAAVAAGADDNPKGDLQEWMQREWKASPRYELVTEQGPAHARHFKVEVFHGQERLGAGEGASKRAAEMNSARHALVNLAAKYPDSTKKRPSEGKLS